MNVGTGRQPAGQPWIIHLCYRSYLSRLVISTSIAWNVFSLHRVWLPQNIHSKEREWHPVGLAYLYWEALAVSVAQRELLGAPILWTPPRGPGEDSVICSVKHLPLDGLSSQGAKLSTSACRTATDIAWK